MVIELNFGEIENAMIEYGVKAPIVLVTNVGDKRLDKLIGIYLTDEENNLDIGDLKKHLSKILPAYAVPKTFYGCKEYPTTSGGKVDRKSLIELLKNNIDKQEEIILPNTVLEQQIYDVVKNYVGFELSIDEDISKILDSSASMALYQDLIKQKIVDQETSIILFSTNQSYHLAFAKNDSIPVFDEGIIVHEIVSMNQMASQIKMKYQNNLFSTHPNNQSI